MEIIIAIAIIGLAVAALLGGLMTSISSSVLHRSLANLDTVLRSNAEEAKDLIEIRDPGWFQDGATFTYNSYNNNALPLSAPAGYGVSLQSVQYWNSVTQQFDPTYNPTDDQTGYQLLTFTATGPNGASESLSIAVSSRK